MYTPCCSTKICIKCAEEWYGKEQKDTCPVCGKNRHDITLDDKAIERSFKSGNIFKGEMDRLLLLQELFMNSPDSVKKEIKQYALEIIESLDNIVPPYHVEFQSLKKFFKNPDGKKRSKRRKSKSKNNLKLKKRQ
jgi:hypothetical protein